MAIIKSIHARQILDSRGNPTVEVEMAISQGIVRASVPSGASTGKHEAWELRDHSRAFRGLGVQKAVRNINTIIAPKLVGKNCRRQQELDQLLIRIDGTPTKRKLGANAILAVSLACLKAGALAMRKPLHGYVSSLANREKCLPRAFFNVLNGGKHADSGLAIQELMIAPNLGSFSTNLQAGSEIYYHLKQLLRAKYGEGSTNVGDEGGFVCRDFRKTSEALDMLMLAISNAGYAGKVDLAIDCAASEFYKNKKYEIEGKKFSAEKLSRWYEELVSRYPIASIEDPFEQEDFKHFASLRKKTKIQIVGDDLTVSNPKRITMALGNGSVSCLLLKVNQIGTVSEALDAAQMMFESGLAVMVSHRSGETEDTFIADLAVGIGCGMIKAGAPCRGERVAKYNQLLRIEEELNGRK